MTTFTVDDPVFCACHVIARFSPLPQRCAASLPPAVFLSLRRPRNILERLPPSHTTLTLIHSLDAHNKVRPAILGCAAQAGWTHSSRCRTSLCCSSGWTCESERIAVAARPLVKDESITRDADRARSRKDNPPLDSTSRLPNNLPVQFACRTVPAPRSERRTLLLKETRNRRHVLHRASRARAHHAPILLRQWCKRKDQGAAPQ